MITRSQLTLIGKAIKPHGHAGEISASIECRADASELGSLIMEIDGIFVPFKVVSSRRRGTDAQLLTIDGIDNDEEAALYSGKDLYCITATLNGLDEDAYCENQDGLTADQLAGFSMKDSNGNLIGKIDDIDVSTDNALFIVISPEDKKILVPIVDEFITDIDMDKLSISVDLPEGLLDL